MIDMLRVVDLHKRLGDFELREINIDVEAGEIFVVLGPSGAGKTTLLDCIAGFKTVDRGHIYLDDEDITGLPPEYRNIGYIPQEPALFPHMDVFRNIEYGLKLRGIQREERKRRVLEVAKFLEIDNLLGRYPNDLSGGEKQRVSLARALAIEPKAMLMDEPLAHIDPILREDLRNYIRKIASRLNVPTIYVTHDQSEAFAIADSLAIMNGGLIVEKGKPDKLLDRPKKLFSARFLGYRNIFDGQVAKTLENISIIEVNNVKFTVPGNYHGYIIIGFRPEDVIVFREKPISSIQNMFKATIKEIINEGPISRILFDVGIKIEGVITRRSLMELGLKKGEKVYIGIKSTSIRTFTKNS